ncbi:unnamed protein product [Arctia plantaginis]|uniref:Lactate/malate dehydrogenase N-terminal domain-containing protein n=1 Tax=Arctia plantaginis TaxID=874455 RepID=A0A8S1BJ52_ARCPL|nr:unnamed protein product [Arctia plantaginis]
MISTLGGMVANRDMLFHHVQDKTNDFVNKVSVIGIGQVGMATVFSLLTQIGVQKCIQMPNLIFILFYL